MHTGPQMNPNARHMGHLIHAADPGLVSPPSMNPANNIPVIPLQTQTPIASGPMVDFSLQPGGVSVDSGNPDLDLDERYHHTRSGTAPDMGAIELGDTWNMSTGPRWARGTMTPWRPPLPPTLDPSWVGLSE